MAHVSMIFRVYFWLRSWREMKAGVVVLLATVMLSSAVGDAFKAGVARRRSREARCLDEPALGQVLALWSQLEAEGLRLLLPEADILRWCPVAYHSLAKALRDAVGACVSGIMSMWACLPQANKNRVLRNCGTLSVGTGNPGHTGCTDIGGGSIKWSVFDDPECGIFKAFAMLKLDVLVLPGARLRNNWKLSFASGLCVVARGGPTFTSCAIIWKRELSFAVAEISVLGNDRQIWLRLDDPSGAVVFLW